MATFNLSDLSPEQYEDLLRRFVVIFIRFRLRMQHLREKPLKTQYLVWWVSKGPTGFKTNKDALQFKQDLFARIEAFIEGERNDGGQADLSG